MRPDCSIRVALLFQLAGAGAFAQHCPAGGPGVLPVAQVRRQSQALSASNRTVAVCGQVTLRPGDLPDDPGNFYIQDSTGGISVQARAPGSYTYGQWILAKGRVTALSTEEPEMEAAELVVAGPGRMPAARPASLDDLARGRLDGWHVVVTGTVVKFSTNDVRDDIVLRDRGHEAEAYARRLRGAPAVLPELVSIGSRVEIKGVAMPTASATMSRVRMRGSQDLLLIESPAFIVTRAGRISAGVALLVALLAAAWIWSLRNRVRSKTAEIRGLLKKAEEASRLKSEFLANVSHEIRTPLHGVIGLHEMALRECVEPGIIRYLELSNQASRHLLALLNDVLDLAAVERGAIQVHLEPISPAPVMRDAAGMFMASASAKSLDIVIEDLGLPSSVMGDRMRLTQVLANLVNNAVKFTERGTVAVKGRAQPEGGGWRLTFEVSDTGIGIQPSDQKRIFEEFRQADGSIRRQYGGSGLGLALSARLVALMGGSISVESEPGRGSKFRFDALCPACAGEAVEPSGNFAGEPAVRQLRLLVVEDNRLNQIVASKLLERDGHVVEIAEDGLAALAAFSRSDYDAILMDIQMPGLDGVSAAREIRGREQHGKRVPILALTAHAGADESGSFARAGMDGVLSKPFSPGQLREALARVAGAARPAVARSNSTQAPAASQDH